MYVFPAYAGVIPSHVLCSLFLLRIPCVCRGNPADEAEMYVIERYSLRMQG